MYKNVLSSRNCGEVCFVHCAIPFLLLMLFFRMGQWIGYFTSMPSRLCRVWSKSYIFWNEFARRKDDFLLCIFIGL